MKKKFTTSKGLVIIENNTLFIRNTINSFRDTGFARIGWRILPAILLVLALVTHDDKPFSTFFRAVFFGLLFLSHLPELFKLIFQTSFSRRIPTDRITSCDVKDDHNGLETHVLLHLKNNRTRTITFRKLEHQYEGFLQEIPAASSNIQIA